MVLERRFEPVGEEERLDEVPHHVDLALLVGLTFLPDDGIIEEIEVFVGVELTFQRHRVPDASRIRSIPSCGLNG